MLELIEVKQYLRLDDNSEDGYLNVLILLSCEMILNYLRIEQLPEPLPESLKQTMLIIIGYFFENREGTKDGIPEVVYTLLRPFRKDVF